MKGKMSEGSAHAVLGRRTCRTCIVCKINSDELAGSVNACDLKLEPDGFEISPSNSLIAHKQMEAGGRGVYTNLAGFRSELSHDTGFDVNYVPPNWKGSLICRGALCVTWNRPPRTAH